MIRVNNLSKSYGQNEVLQNISLNLTKGNIYGFVGENGAGKTTLFRCISGLDDYSGQIESDLMPLKNHLGFLQTNPEMMSRITGWEYLKLHTIAREVPSDDFDEQNIFELPLRQYAEHYSTGMQKKLALLALLVQKNDIYILDEPFNGVDVHSNIIISEIIQKLKSLGKTILISSHIYSSLSENCDEIFLLKNGQIKDKVKKESFDKLGSDLKDFIIGDQLDKIKWE